VAENPGAGWRRTPSATRVRPLPAAGLAARQRRRFFFLAFYSKRYFPPQLSKACTVRHRFPAARFSTRLSVMSLSPASGIHQARWLPAGFHCSGQAQAVRLVHRSICHHDSLPATIGWSARGLQERQGGSCPGIAPLRRRAASTMKHCRCCAAPGVSSSSQQREFLGQRHRGLFVALSDRHCSHGQVISERCHVRLDNDLEM
jgi:hypothetical protein